MLSLLIFCDEGIICRQAYMQSLQRHKPKDSQGQKSLHCKLIPRQNWTIAVWLHKVWLYFKHIQQMPCMTQAFVCSRCWHKSILKRFIFCNYFSNSGGFILRGLTVAHTDHHVSSTKCCTFSLFKLYHFYSAEKSSFLKGQKSNLTPTRAQEVSQHLDSCQVMLSDCSTYQLAAWHTD